MWIDAATGAILRTELELEFDDVAYTLTTRFERVAAMDLVLPVALDERYATPDEIVTGSATYTNYRRFQTGARRPDSALTAGLQACATERSCQEPTRSLVAQAFRPAPPSSAGSAA